MLPTQEGETLQAHPDLPGGYDHVDVCLEDTWVLEPGVEGPGEWRRLGAYFPRTEIRSDPHASTASELSGRARAAAVVTEGDRLVVCGGHGMRPQAGHNPYGALILTELSEATSDLCEHPGLNIPGD